MFGFLNISKSSGFHGEPGYTFERCHDLCPLCYLTSLPAPRAPFALLPPPGCCMLVQSFNQFRWELSARPSITALQAACTGSTPLTFPVFLYCHPPPPKKMRLIALFFCFWSQESLRPHHPQSARRTTSKPEM